jgi:uncharacterized protein YqjF (DUF2071 family)
MRGPPIFSVQVRNFALVTHAVPPERVLRHLPSAYELELCEGAEGRVALVSATCFCNEDFRPAGIGFPRHTFNESTYRTYVTHKGRRGVYFFGRYLGTRLAWSSQRAMARDTYRADFDVATDVRGDRYNSLVCHASSHRGDTRFVVDASEEPQPTELFETGEQHAQFLTYRLHGFFTTSAGPQGHMPVGHPRMAPLSGRLSQGRFDLWRRLGIVNEDETADPHSVLIVRKSPFRLFAPRRLS